MLPPHLEYIAPTSIGAAVEALASRPNAMFTAGSYRLLIDLKMRRIQVGTLVDLRKLRELYPIASTGTRLEIGAMVSLDTLARDERVLASAAALAQAAAHTGDAQIRNMAAVGGTLAYDASASDIAAALIALNADIYTHRSNGERVIPAADFFTADSKTALHQDEIITMIGVPNGFERSAFEKYAHPASLSAIIAVAAAVTFDADGRVAQCGLGVSGSTARALRLSAAETVLIGSARR
jgi:carbon-monoxide dehydrogenase medium subunit